jgi:hypothetical protein
MYDDGLSMDKREGAYEAWFDDNTFHRVLRNSAAIHHRTIDFRRNRTGSFIRLNLGRARRNMMVSIRCSDVPLSTSGFDHSGCEAGR